VCINYRSNAEAAEELLAELNEKGVKAISAQADIAVEREVIGLFERVDRSLGTITSLVNNVGILLPQMKLEQMDSERINRILATNVTGYFICCREAVKRMSTAHGGRGGAIVNVSSAAARLGSAGEYIDYAASKGAVDTLTRGLALEVAEEGIRVNCVRPGFIKTDIHRDGGEPDRVERIRPTIPLQRGGEPEEVADAIAWLLSEEASYVTGSFVDIAGGR
jgi:NAD(P)-dependent dehydrogenase (short-subunit alcohol dehydrogenase family)